MNVNFLDIFSNTQKQATLQLRNSGSAQELNEKLTQAAAECFIRTPELYLSKQFTIGMLCQWAPLYILHRYGISMTVTDFNGSKNTTTTNGDFVLLSAADLAKILQNAETHYKDIQRSVVADALFDLYHTRVINDDPNFYAYSFEADMKEWAEEFLHTLGDPLKFLSQQHKWLKLRLLEEVEVKNE